MGLTIKNAILKVVVLLGIVTCIGCSSAKQQEIVRTNTIVQERFIPADPGAVEFVWEPPLVNVIDQPPGIDPEGHYYRPAHQAIVEIKPGRWQYYKDAR